MIFSTAFSFIRLSRPKSLVRDLNHRNIDKFKIFTKGFIYLKLTMNNVCDKSVDIHRFPDHEMQVSYPAFNPFLELSEIFLALPAGSA